MNMLSDFQVDIYILNTCKLWSRFLAPDSGRRSRLLTHFPIRLVWYACVSTQSLRSIVSGNPPKYDENFMKCFSNNNISLDCTR